MRRKLLWFTLSFSIGISIFFLIEDHGFIPVFVFSLLSFYMMHISGFMRPVLAVAFVIGLIYACAFSGIIQTHSFNQYTSHKVTCCGTVVKVKEKRGNKCDIRFKVSSFGTEKNKQQSTIPFNILIESNNDSPICDLTGSTIIVTLIPEKPEKAKKKYDFDRLRYLYSQKMFFMSKKIEILEDIGTPLHYIPIKSAVSLREEFLNTLPVSKKASAFTKGVIFGITSDINTESINSFRTNGTAHVLAVSGLHIGILWGIYKILSRYIDGKFFRIFFSFLMLFYGTMCLWSFSVIRSESVIFLKLASDKRKRAFDLLTALSLIFLITLIENPFAIFNIGLQMSFLAVTSIVFLIPFFRRKKPFFPSEVVTALLIQPILAPYMLMTFGSFSPSGIIVNIPIIFIISIFVPAAISDLFFFAITGHHIPLIPTVLEGLSIMAEQINGFFPGPFPVIEMDFHPFFVVIFYGSFFFFTSEYFEIALGRKKEETAFIPVMTVLLALLTLFSPDSFNLFA